MASDQNALAELAKELKHSLDLQLPGTSYYHDRTVFCTPQVIDKSQRIVAELAKVIDRMGAHGVVKSYSEVIGTVDRCRAIAEEGVGYGK